MAKTRKKVSLDDLRPKGTRMYIVDPGSGEETEAYFDVIGQDSKEYRQAVNAVVKARQEKGSEPTFEDVQNENVELLATTVVGWNNDVFGEFSKQGVKDLLADPAFSAIREQLDDFTENRKNFFRKGN